MTDTDHSSDEHSDDLGAAFVAAVGNGVVLALRFFWTLLRVAVAGVVVAAAQLTSRKRRARLRRWFLLEGDRWTIVWLVVGGVGLTTFLLSLAGTIGVASGTFVGTVFGGVISGLFSFVPIVIAVNQLTVSRVFGTPGQVREEIEDVDAFRKEIEDRHPSRSVSPTEPAPFLSMALDVVADRVDDLEETIADADPEVRAAVEEFVTVLRDQTGTVRRRLDGSHQRLIEVLPPMMGDSYSRNVNDARKLRLTFADELSAEARESLADLEETFVTLDVLRQYFKALYLTEELSYLSRLVGYTGTGAFVVSLVVITAFAHGQPFGGHPVLLDALLSVSVAAVTVPFAVLLSFVVRVATIAKRTAAPGEFTPTRETPEYATHRDEDYAVLPEGDQ